MAEITTAYGQKISLTTDEAGHRIIGLHDIDPRSGERTTLAEIGLERWEWDGLLAEFDAEPEVADV